MGYEVKLYVGEIHRNQRWPESSRHCWFQVIGMVDLSKPGYDSAIYDHSKRVDLASLVYIYASDGNTQITEDAYGKLLSAIPLLEVLEALQEGAENYGFYGTHIAISMLETAQKSSKRGLQCVLYGY